MSNIDNKLKFLQANLNHCKSATDVFARNQLRDQIDVGLIT